MNFPVSVPLTGRVRLCLELLREQGIKNKVIVDIGSSFGWLEKAMEQEGAKRIIGIDSDSEAIEFAKRNVKGATFLVADAINISLPEGYADIVILFDLIEHVPQGSELAILKQANKILKDNGVLLLSTPNSHLFSNIFDVAWYFGHRHYSKKAIVAMLKRAGFKVFIIETRGNILSSLYLSWFYITKRLLSISQPRSTFFERLDDLGYNSEGITDIFLVAQKTQMLAK